MHIVLVLFRFRGSDWRMSEPDETARPADREDFKDALAYALRFAGRKRAHTADDVMARITAERIAEH